MAPTPSRLLNRVSSAVTRPTSVDNAEEDAAPISVSVNATVPPAFRVFDVLPIVSVIGYVGLLIFAAIMQLTCGVVYCIVAKIRKKEAASRELQTCDTKE